MRTPPTFTDALSYLLAIDRRSDLTLHHYTTASAFLSILQSRKMWATNLQFTNDPTELVYSESVINSVFDTFEQESLKWTRVVSALRQRFDAGKRQSEFYSVSFCEDGDLLSQWRGYGAAGNGIAIGWGAASKMPTDPLRIVIRYERSSQEFILRRILERHVAFVISGAEDLRPPQIEARLTLASESLNRLLTICMYSFKHQTFLAEREVRYVYEVRNGRYPRGVTLQFRDFGGLVKPYIEVDFSRCELRQVVFGPTNNPALTEKWLTMALHSLGFSRVVIKASSVPMR